LRSWRVEDMKEEATRDLVSPDPNSEQLFITSSAPFTFDRAGRTVCLPTEDAVNNKRPPGATLVDLVEFRQGRTIPGVVGPMLSPDGSRIVALAKDWAGLPLSAPLVVYDTSSGKVLHGPTAQHYSANLGFTGDGTGIVVREKATDPPVLLDSSTLKKLPWPADPRTLLRDKDGIVLRSGPLWAWVVGEQLAALGVKEEVTPLTWTSDGRDVWVGRPGYYPNRWDGKRKQWSEPWTRHDQVDWGMPLCSPDGRMAAMNVPGARVGARLHVWRLP
jgi:hypothetical protein